MTEPAAFLSYARFDDRHHDGLISDLRARLSAEVRVQTGRDFPIFQDREDITWGQNWQSRIDEALDAVTLLLPVVTPGFFRSRACRGEVERFLARERALGRRDLILPIYFVSAPEFEDEGRREADDLARELWTRQFADWRELRFEPLTAPAARRAVAALATQVRTDRSPALGTAPPGVTPSRLPPAVGALHRAAPEPPTHVVDAYGRGDFTTIDAALMAARAGDRILVRPALYQESLVIDKPVELLGDGPREDIEIHARGRDAVLFRAAVGRLAGMTLRQLDTKSEFSCVTVAGGRLDLEACDIAGGGAGGCVGVFGGAAPRICGNYIHGGRHVGVTVVGNSLGLIEDNEISANHFVGVGIYLEANPTVRRNRIHNQSVGVLVADGGLGRIEDNDIIDNGLTGLLISNAANPTVRHNRVHRNPNGITFHRNGRGRIEDNDISANYASGVETWDGSCPVVRRNQIRRNGRWGVWIRSGGLGIVEDNDLRDNSSGTVSVDDAATALFISARNQT